MPAGTTGKYAIDADLMAEWGNFINAVDAARASRNDTLDTFGQSDPVTQGLIDAYNNYETAINNAFQSFQSRVGNQFTNFRTVMTSIFDQFQSVLSGASRVSDATSRNTAYDNALNAMMKNNSPLAETLSGNQQQTAPILVEIQTGGPGFDDLGGGFAQEIVLSSGEEGSVALCSIDYKEKPEDDVPAVAAIDGSPSQFIKGGDRATISMMGISLMTGSIVEDDHNTDSDGYAFRVEDDKWLLEGVTIMGCFMLDPTELGDSSGGGGSSSVKYVLAEEPVFNPNGLANRIYARIGGEVVPVFAPWPEFGRKPAQGELATGVNFDVAGHWTIAEMWEYFRFFYYGSSGNEMRIKYPIATVDDDRLIWPRGLPTAFLNDDFINQVTPWQIKDRNREKGAEAMVRSKNYQGWKLGAALEDSIKVAGAYALYCYPHDKSFKSVLSIVRTRAHDTINNGGGVGIGLIKPINNLPANVNVPVVLESNIRRDWRDSFTSVWVVGDIVFLEMRFQWTPNGDDAENTLSPAWTRGGRDKIIEELEGDPINDGDPPKDPLTGETIESEEKLFMDAVTDSGEFGGGQASDVGSVGYWKLATAAYPTVFCAYKIKEDLDLYEGTKYAGYPMIKRGHKVLSHLLSWVARIRQDTSFERFLPHRVRVELESYYYPGAWHIVTDNDGFEVDAAGRIYFPGLRDYPLNGDQDNGTWYGQMDQAYTTIRPRGIRMTLGVFLDTRLNYGMALGRDFLATVGDFAAKTKNIVVSDGGGERQYWSPGTKRQLVIDTGDTFREYLRKGAFPIPEALENASSSFPEKVFGEEGNGQADRDGDQTPELLTHKKFAQTYAQRRFLDIVRPKRNSTFRFSGLVPWHPGTFVKTLDNTGGQQASKWPVAGVLQKVSIRMETQETVFDAC